MDPPQVLTSQRFLYGRVSQPFVTVDIEVFRHGPPSNNDLTDIYFFHLFFLCFCLFFFTTKVQQFVHFMSTRHMYYTCIIYALIMYM